MSSDDRAPKSATTHVIEVAPLTQRRHGVFTIASGLDAGRVLTLPPGAIVTLGRAAECMFSFDDPSLSREHARVMRVGSEYFLRDESSRNGTFVNNVRVNRAIELRNGDRVQLGSGTVLRFALVDDEEEAAMRRIYEAAILDGLTGVHNRKHFEERLTAELAHATRNASPLSVIMIDVDHFKRVNDTYGHLAGDAVLRTVASTMSKCLRQEDTLARYGGEEFVVLLRGPGQQALALAERLRGANESTPIQFEERTIRITSSGGVASLDEVGMRPERAALIGAADGRLYRAKEAGRNRVFGA
ncbi:MAG: GGDEF domain-containing protein [Polyangiaceae bacterium]